MILSLLLFACQEPADVVLRGGVVLPMDGEPSATAIALRGDRIVFVGDDHSAKALIGRNTYVEDLDGRAVLPGFIDAHNHLVWSGTELLAVDLFEASTLEEMLEIIAEFAADHPSDPWVQGSGWDVSLFNDSLTKEQLDGVVSDRPVYMASADSHSAWVNSAALALAGVTADTPDPPNGRIERDDSGEPTGVLREDAIYLVADYIPGYTEAQVDEGLDNALAEAASYGLTTVVDPTTSGWMLSGYRRAEDKGELTLRVWAGVEVDASHPDRVVPTVRAMANQYSSERVRITSAKLYIDGVLESQTAYLVDPYVDGSNTPPTFTDEDLNSAVTQLEADGIQIHAHAIGDGAVRQILNALEASQLANGAADRRPLLAHLELIHPEDLSRFVELGVYADFQMLWAYPDLYITEWTIPYIGEERGERLYPIGSVAETGAVLVAGSDWSVSTMNPWEAIEVAVTRQDPWDGGEALNSEEAISLEQAIAAFTRDGARAVFAEGSLGTLTVNKTADLVVVDQDPFSISPQELSDVVVTGTWVDGKQVYGEQSAPAARQLHRHSSPHEH